eukprot:scaffold132485_cov45-Phaeocystis_antarctica.AAC.1
MHASDAAVFAKQALRSLWMRLAYCCCPRHLWLRPPMVAAFVTYGCSLPRLWLQPQSPTVAASVTYGCRRSAHWPRRGPRRGSAQPRSNPTTTLILTLTPAPSPIALSPPPQRKRKGVAAPPPHARLHEGCSAGCGGPPVLAPPSALCDHSMHGFTRHARRLAVWGLSVITPVYALRSLSTENIA